MADDPWAAFRTPTSPAPAQDEWAAFRAPAPAATPQRPGAFERAARFADNMVRQAARGATFGFMDEIAAGLNTGGGMWGDYNAALAAERARDKQFEAESPIAATVGQIAGGAAVPIGAATRGASLGGAMVRGALTGGAQGAATGFGEGEGGLAPRLEGAQTGALLGGAIGGAVPLALAGGAAVGRGVGRAIGGGSNATAERTILRDIERAGMTPQEVATASREAGTAPVMLADVAGENVAQTAQTIARMPGAGRDMAAREIAARGGANQTDRLTGQVREFISAQNFRQSADDLVTRRRDAAAPAYERAWRIQLTPDEYASVAPFVNDRIGQEALQRGLRVIELESLAARRPFDPAAYGVERAQNGWRPIEGQTPTMRLMDAVKRGYDALVEDFRDPFGRLQLTEYGRAVNAVRAEYRGTLAGMFPPYRRALESWSGPSGTLEAMSIGRRLLQEGPDAAEIRAAQIARLPPGDREAFRIGIARGLLDRIEGATDAQELTRLNRVFGTPAIRQRLRAAFDSEDDFRRFAGEMQREIQMARTNANIAPRGGSPTAPMQERMADLRSPPAGPIANAVVDRGLEPQPNLLRALAQGGSPLEAPNILARRFFAARDDAALRRDMGAMAPYLFTTDPAARQRLADALVARQMRDEAVSRVAGPAVRGLARGGTAAAALSTD